jgi:raffinose/stachyose/melibiose transport system permease protein
MTPARTSDAPQPSPASARRRMLGRRVQRRPRLPGETRGVAYLYVLPAGLLYGIFVLIPLVRGIRLSFYDWNGIGSQTWTGLANYREIAADDVLRSAFLHSFVLVLFYSALPVAIGLVVTAALSRARVRGFTFFRTVLFLPQVLPLVAVGAIWRWVYAPEGGLNELLRAVGLDFLTHAWLADFSLALPAVGLVGTWVLFGFCIVLFLAGVQKIPPSLYDASRVDGAGAVREFFAVTLPGLRSEIAVAFVLTMMAAIRSFDVVYVTTQGGPGFSTTVPAYQVYREAFFYGDIGIAAALGVVLALLIVVVMVVLLRIEGRGAAER